MIVREREFGEDFRWMEEPRVGSLIDLAAVWWERNAARGAAGRIPGFVPTDYRQGGAILSWLAESGLGQGAKFCEWGSGLGVMTILADWLGWDAVGIEIEADLVEAAQQLARDVGSQAQFVKGSFLPRACPHWVDESDHISWLYLESDGVYDRLGLEIDDFQLVFVYPWPGEGRLMLELFERHGRAGSYLLSYHGAAEWHLWQKMTD